jgi:hypothetical protein
MNDETATPAVDLSGIPREFQPVVEKYGREMFALVMNAGMCSQGTKVLAALAQKHGSRGGLHALGVLSQAFNQISTAYCKQMGWEEGILQQCDRDIGLAFAGRIEVPGQSLILDS